MKKTLALMMSITMMAALTACSGGADTPATTTAVAPTTQTEKAAEAAPTAEPKAEAKAENLNIRIPVPYEITVIHTYCDQENDSGRMNADFDDNAWYTACCHVVQTCFAAFLTRKRMNEAKVLLKNTNMKMYEIAQKTGYTSQHYFSNAFKKAMGISPADYRKNLLK